MANRGVLMLNLDSFGSWLGWTELVVNGPPQLEEYAAIFFTSSGHHHEPVAGSFAVGP